MWTLENRPRYDRGALRYPRGLTEVEWTSIGPMIPPAKRGGSKRTVDLRGVVNGLLHILGTGGQWRAIPKDLPPRSTLHGSFMRWDWDGHAGAHPPRALRAVPRAGRARGQSDGGDHRHSDRQGRGKGGASIDPHGYDGGKKIKGKKRHLLADTLGPMLHAVVHTAGLQDRDGGAPLVATLSGLFPFLRTLYADAGYQGPKFQAAPRPR